MQEGDVLDVGEEDPLVQKFVVQVDDEQRVLKAVDVADDVAYAGGPVPYAGGPGGGFVLNHAPILERNALSVHTGAGGFAGGLGEAGRTGIVSFQLLGIEC